MTAPGSFRSFDEFYRSQNVRLFHFFRRKVGREAAPDLVQEAFTRMLRCGAFERVENPQAYLTRTARNLLIERDRTWRRKGCVLYPWMKRGMLQSSPTKNGGFSQRNCVGLIDGRSSRCRAERDGYS